jgi:hypothetical protein
MYSRNPERHARALVGCAFGHTIVGTAEDLRQAKRAIGRAIQFYMAAGLTRDQAVNQVITLAQMLGELE